MHLITTTPGEAPRTRNSWRLITIYMENLYRRRRRPQAQRPAVETLQAGQVGKFPMATPNTTSLLQPTNQHLEYLDLDLRLLYLQHQFPRLSTPFLLMFCKPWRIEMDP